MKPKPIINNKKQCTRCQKWKHLKEFNAGKSVDRKRSQCRNCERDYKLMLRYGLTGKQIDDFWGRTHCEICNNPFINYGVGTGRFKCIDHDHVTGMARGVICNACNAAMGYTGDSIAVMKKIIAYLKHGGSLRNRK